MSDLYEDPWKDPKRLGLPRRTQVLFANRQWAVTKNGFGKAVDCLPETFA
jgi:hypothetical protein